MSSLNKVIIMGNLTRDPDFKQLGSGQSVCKLSIASNRQYKNRQTGDMVQEVCYVDIDVWGPQAESCKEFLQKGRPILVEGRLKFDSWKDNEGQTRSKHGIVADRVVFLYGSSQPDDNSLSNNSEVDQDILDKLNELKKSKSAEPKKADKKIVSAVKSKAKPTDESSDNEIDFQDEPPFEDELPF